MAEPTNEEIAEVLEKACDELIVRGWGQGNYVEDGTGAVCTLGAIGCSVDGDPYLWEDGAQREEAAYAVFDRLAGAGNNDDLVALIGKWNDEPGRTVDDVHDLLRSTAKELRERSS